jgi:peptide-methionine (S)-S-oxide reductase
MSTCRWPGASPDHSTLPDPEKDIPASEATQRVVLGGGCFWCVEAVYQKLDGVMAVVSGYAGGDESTANYAAVCSGMTGHAEVVAIDFDSSRISFGAVLKVFFSVAHDPTQYNRQGNDVGPQYRSAVFYADDAQREVAAAYIQQLDAAAVFASPIVTTLEPLRRFYPAEPAHQNYADRNLQQPYIAMVSTPKVRKLEKLYPAQLRRP